MPETPIIPRAAIDAGCALSTTGRGNRPEYRRRIEDIIAAALPHLGGVARFEPAPDGAEHLASVKLTDGLTGVVREVEVWTERQADGAIEWSIRVDGVDHGGGQARHHADALMDAARHLADRRNGLRAAVREEAPDA